MIHADSQTTAGPYDMAAMDFLNVGLCPIPCGGPDGKEPLVSWGKWQRRPRPGALARMLARPKLAQANIGILTGLSGVTIVDCDGEAVLVRALGLFGPTPLITRTPSGGHHAWYRAKGERCANLRSHGLTIDVKGKGGFVVAPPSVRPSGAHAGKTYSFVEGGLRDVARLPGIRREIAATFGLIEHTEAKPAATTIETGRRNNELFRIALREARTARSEDELLATMRDINALSCDAPLPDRELAKSVAQAWGMQQAGRNWAGTGAFVCDHGRLHDLTPDAFYLLAHLHWFHGAREDPFALVLEAMVEANSIPRLSLRALRRARSELLDRGYLIRVHAGGRGPKDPAKFILGEDPAKGVRN